jgi:hypothetical protein
MSLPSRALEVGFLVNKQLQPGLPDFSSYDIPRKNIPNNHEIPTYTKCSQYMANDHELYQHLLLRDPPKFTQIWIFGLKIYYHVANLVPAGVNREKEILPKDQMLKKMLLNLKKL